MTIFFSKPDGIVMAITEMRRAAETVSNSVQTELWTSMVEDELAALRAKVQTLKTSNKTL